MMKRSLGCAVGLGLALAACGGGGDGDDIDAAIAPPDADLRCTSSSDCAATATTPVCDVPSGACVECTVSEAALCVGAEPVCGDDNQCRACTAHSDCPDDSACVLEGEGQGTCVAADVTFHVATDGNDGDDCQTPATACATLGGAAGKLNADTPSAIRISAGTFSAAAIASFAGNVVRVYGAGVDMTTLDRTGNGAVVDVSAGTEMTLADVTISGATGAGAAAVTLTAGGSRPVLLLTRATVGPNATRGITQVGGEVVLERAKVLSNTGTGIVCSNDGIAQATTRLRSVELVGNALGGIDSQCEFEVVSSVLARNGGTTAVVGGARFANSAARPIFRFNTVALNEVSAATIVAGLNCDINPIEFNSGFNLIYRNFRGDVAGNANQAGGDVECLGDGSVIDINAGNPLGFVSPDDLPFDFHLTQGSPTTVRNAAGMTCDPAFDLDGDVRPFGGECDVGADELTQ